ncbi:hypothetical protein FB45DRAFT_894601 [Roridomyces roridus]|uniref:Uncharacterized protein n=1 Tax=Roridomyces roridus TaxID=1738132 RepID=A0AAD7CG73_9AGAR|nr:hypothetical protein FB45DRAFT_894601 [Roridomyces roridus]
MKLTELGHDVLLEICGHIYENHPRDRVFLGWYEIDRDSLERHRIFPGPPAQILLELASMHSQLAIATRPYIWREVAVVFAGTEGRKEEIIEDYNPTHFERAQMPHIARFVRALFIACCSDGLLPQSLPGTISSFTSLRSVCFTRFPNQAFDDQPCMDENLAAAIRMHPSIHTLSVCAMTDCANLIQPKTTKTYNIALNFCLGNSMALLARPNAIKYLCLRTHDYQPQAVEESWPCDIWDTLEHLDAGYDTTNLVPDSQNRINQRFIFTSFKNYLSTGRRLALRSLDLSGVLPRHVVPYLEMFNGIGLETLTYIPTWHANMQFETLAEVWVNFPKLKRLRVAIPLRDEEFHSETLNHLMIQPDTIDLLQKFSDLVDSVCRSTERISTRRKWRNSGHLYGDWLTLVRC